MVGHVAKAAFGLAQRLGHLAAQARGGDGAGDASDQLARRERFGEIVVCACIEPFDLGLFAGAGRQHDHRQVAQLGVLADGRQKPKAVEPGHHHVGDQQLGPGRARRGERGVAVSDGVHGVTLSLQEAADIGAQVGIVVGQEDGRTVGGRLPRDRRRLAGDEGVLHGPA